MFGCSENNPDGYIETYNKIIIHSDSQLVVMSLNGQIAIARDIVNLVEGVNCLRA